MEITRVTHWTQLPKMEEAMNDFQRQVIEIALDVCKGNRLQVAEALGIHRNTLARLAAERGIDPRYGRQQGWVRRSA